MADHRFGLRDLILAVLVLAVAGLILHMFLGASPSDGSVSDGRATAPSSEEALSQAPARLEGRGLIQRLDALEARLEALERRDAPPLAQPTAAGISLQPERVWDAEDVSRLRAGLRQVRQVEQEEREALRWRVLVDRLVPGALEGERQRAAGRLTRYMRDVRALYPAEGGPSPSPEERAVQAAKTEALRSQLEKDLSGDLSDDDAAQKLAASMPGGWPPQGAVQPPVRPPPR